MFLCIPQIWHQYAGHMTVIVSVFHQIIDQVSSEEMGGVVYGDPYTKQCPQLSQVSLRKKVFFFPGKWQGHSPYITARIFSKVDLQTYFSVGGYKNLLYIASHFAY